MKTNLKLNLTDITIGILKGDEALSSMVGSRIIRLIAENGTNFPFVVVSRTNVSVGRGTKDFGTTFQQIKVDCIHNRYNTEIPERIIELLDEFEYVDTETNLSYRFNILNASEEWNDAYVQTLIFNVEVE